jgi:hypothetical protein
MSAPVLMNPSAFETVYGFQLLDTLHNFFPELMYSDLFHSSNMMRWMQHRVETLFPEQYLHHKQLYRLYSAVGRRNEFANWIQLQEPAAAPAREPARVPATPARVPRAQPTSPPQIQRPVARTIPVRTTDPAGAEELMNILFGPLPATTTTTATYDLGNSLVNLLGLAALTQPGANVAQQLFQDVPVFPTPAQVRAGSTELIYSDIPRDTECSICHDSEGDSTWRRLHCSHYFHRDCIDHWFTGHVNCPVCRADVRTVATPRHAQNNTSPAGGDARS